MKGIFMATDNKNIAIIKQSIKEQKLMFEYTNNIYDQLRIKALALIAGEVAILTFLFNTWNFRLILKDSDRIFFFFTGVVFMGLAFAFLLWIISTVPWKFPHDLQSADAHLNNKNYDSEESFLKILHDDYIVVNKHNSEIVTNKYKKFNWTIFLLAAGVIIVMVIKFGGPQ